MSTPQLEDAQETIFKLKEKLRVFKEREEWMRQDWTSARSALNTMSDLCNALKVERDHLVTLLRRSLDHHDSHATTCYKECDAFVAELERRESEGTV